MPNKTIYVSDSDLPVFRAAETKAREMGVSLSRLIAMRLAEPGKESDAARAMEIKTAVTRTVRRLVQLAAEDI